MISPRTETLLVINIPAESKSWNKPVVDAKHSTSTFSSSDVDTRMETSLPESPSLAAKFSSSYSSSITTVGTTTIEKDVLAPDHRSQWKA